MREKYRIKQSLKLFYYPHEWQNMMGLANENQKQTFKILLHTGARFNEAKHIKVSDVDFGRNSLVLRVTKRRAKKKETRPSPRHIPISSKFSKYLKKLKKKHSLKSEDYFPLLKNPASNIALKKLTKKIGRKDYLDFSVHNIRKTFECWLIALGNDGFKVAKHLGHTAQVAMNDYISPDIFTYDDKRRIRYILGDLYSRDRGAF